MASSTNVNINTTIGNNMLGKQFASFEALDNFLQLFQRENNVQLHKTRANKLNSKYVLKKYCFKACKAKKELIYYYLVYNCVKGGRFQERGSGVRQRRTFRQGCPFVIQIGVSRGGKSLVIQKFENVHNHEINKAMFEALPKQRRLMSLEEPELGAISNLQLYKKIEKKLINDETEEVLASQDLCNIVMGTSNVNVGRSNEDQFEECVAFFKSVDNSTVEVFICGNDFQGLFFQTKRMKRAFSLYPELLLCGASYKLNNLKIPLYLGLLLIVNGNGEGEVVCIFLLVNDTTDNIQKVLHIFKKHNTRWEETKGVMTDNDFKRRDAFRATFPNVNLAVCLFHTLQIFKTTITMAKMGITNYEKDECLQILDKIAHSSSKSEYAIYYDELLSTGCSNVIDYFNRNWHGIRNEWVIGLLVASTTTYGVTTTNHLKSWYRKIKYLVAEDISLSQFANDLLILIDTLYEFRKIKFCQFLNTRNTMHRDEFENDLAVFLTPYAFKLVRESLEQAKLMAGIKEEYNYNATKDSCLCYEFKKFTLPCKHMFLRRILDGLPFFDENEVPKRYLLKTYRELFELDSNSSVKLVQWDKPNIVMDDIATASLDDQPEKQQTRSLSQLRKPGLRTLSDSEKYNLAHEEVKKACNALIHYDTPDFLKALDELKRLTEIVTSRETASLSFNKTESDQHLLSQSTKIKRIGRPKGAKSLR